jgi:hypothetical protein
MSDPHTRLDALLERRDGLNAAVATLHTRWRNLWQDIDNDYESVIAHLDDIIAELTREHAAVDIVDKYERLRQLIIDDRAKCPSAPS